MSRAALHRPTRVASAAVPKRVENAECCTEALEISTVFETKLQSESARKGSWFTQTDDETSAGTL
jgi:hypothetical protein